MLDQHIGLWCTCNKSCLVWLKKRTVTKDVWVLCDLTFYFITICYIAWNVHIFIVPRQANTLWVDWSLWKIELSWHHFWLHVMTTCSQVSYCACEYRSVQPKAVFNCLGHVWLTKIAVELDDTSSFSHLWFICSSFKNIPL